MLIFSQRSLSPENSYALAVKSLSALPAPSVWLGTFGSVDLVAVERYERLRNGVRPPGADDEELEGAPLDSSGN